MPPALKAIVTDIDGTLTDERRILDPYAVQWLRKAVLGGIPVVIATGNVLPIALALHRSLGLNGPIVAENGGVIYRRIDGEDSLVRLARKSVALRAFRAIQRSGLPVRRLFTDRWRETEVALEQNVAILPLRKLVRGLGVRVEATGYAIHLIEEGCGKLPALRRALAYIGLTPADCLIAGDGDNDEAMLRAAGWGLSFRTASARARRAADYVARASYAKGFVEGLIRSRVVPRYSRSRRFLRVGRVVLSVRRPG